MVTARRHHRRRLRGAQRGQGDAGARHRRPDHPRAGRRGRRGVARQHLSGRGLRRAVALYSWSWSLNPTWPPPTPARSTSSTTSSETAAGAGLLDLVHTGQEVTAARYDEARSDLDGLDRRRRDLRRRRRRHRGRPALGPGRARPARPRHVHGPGVPLGAVAPRRRPGRRAGRGRRDGCQRYPVRPRDRRPGRRDDGVPALRALRRPEAGRRVPRPSPPARRPTPARLRGERRSVFRFTEVLNRALEGDSRPPRRC